MFIEPLTIHFSTTFDQNGKLETGLKLDFCIMSSPIFLSNGLIILSFHDAVKTPHPKEMLTNDVLLVEICLGFL